MAEKEAQKRYKFKEVCIRLTEGHPLFSDQPLSSPMAALDVMRREMSQYDREVLCVINMNNRLKPINFHVVSVGDLSTSIAAIPNILKAGILSNAGSFLLLHNHPSGDVSPSREDIELTKKVIEAGKILGIPCMDHIVIGGGSGSYCSMREAQLADFSNQIISMTAEDILHVADDHQTYEGETETMPENARNDAQVPDFVQEAEAQLAKEATEGKESQAPKREEVTIKFGKGLAEPFTAKDGRDFTRIMIPNADKADKTPWASFVLPSKAVHENQYGKGLWAKIPANGTTVVTKPVLKGQDEQGKNIWEDTKTQIPNRELKSMVEAYKTRAPQEKSAEPRESAREKLDALVKDTAEKLSVDKKPKVKAKAKTKGPDL
mgnify:CR=1 FL=1